MQIVEPDPSDPIYLLRPAKLPLFTPEVAKILRLLLYGL